MPSLVELATQLVTAQASTVAMTTDYIISSLNRIHSTLEELERSQSKLIEEPPEAKPNLIDAFREHEIVCLLCGKAYAALGPHLVSKHNVSPDEYREQFGIPYYQPLIATSKYERRKSVTLRRSQKAEAIDKPDSLVVTPPISGAADIPVTKRGRSRKVAVPVSNP
jgi:predicted transcriptional regulator